MSYFFKSGVIISVRMGNIQNSLSYSVGKPYRSMKVGLELWLFGSFWMTLDCLCISVKLSLHFFQLWERRTGIRAYRPREVMVATKNGAHEGETHPVRSCKRASKRLLRRQFQICSSLCTLFSRWYHKDRNSPIVFTFFQILHHCKPRALVTTRS